ncbi:RraA family protein [Vibrio sp. ZSDE26]|uniref:Putative 4-hydroxy-4-methyl-2-oxoglutarate aldolase n=1 Tax=Vibrio amylolyticus TaxID=2847292 RepID=A0A9X1XKA4_9VIBR|nr:RraA family protein [Vibrio amylolyticus]MCK6263248.1 RraA family protein [Vibrio amylolyticus]
MKSIELIYKEIYSGVAYDAMRLLGYRPEQFYINIKPLAGYDKTIIGPAFTTYGEVVSKESNYQELDNIRLDIYKKKYFNDNPIVLLQANDNYVAHSGDITSQIYQTLGAKGFVTDGNVRDLDKIDELNFPVFAENSNPIDAIDYWALTKYNVDIVIKSVSISPGDLIISSKDGVIRVPKSDLFRFEEKVRAILNKENKARDTIFKIKNETDMSDILSKLVEEEGRW